MRIAHLSDTHFGTERPDVLTGLLSALEQLRPEVVILSGDVTQRARREEFEAARRFVDALPRGAHRIVIPGNHEHPLYDVWRRFTAPLAFHKRFFGPPESLWSRDDIALLAVDATTRWRHSKGRLPAAHLRQRLRSARASCERNGLLLVVAHQPLWTAWGEDKSQTLIGRHETAQVLAEARADVFFSGHVHVPLIDTSVLSDPQLSWSFVMCGAGTAVSHRVREGAPNSFNVMDIGAGRTELWIARHDWDGSAFHPAAVRVFRRGSGGWTTQ